MRQKSPFKPGEQVRLKRCENPSCSCYFMAEGFIGTVGKRVGRTVLVDFGLKFEGFMRWETGFRIATIEEHLERVS